MGSTVPGPNNKDQVRSSNCLAHVRYPLISRTKRLTKLTGLDPQDLLCPYSTKRPILLLHIKADGFASGWWFPASGQWDSVLYRSREPPVGIVWWIKKYDDPSISIHYPHPRVGEGLFYRNPRRLWPGVFVGRGATVVPGIIPAPKGRSDLQAWQLPLPRSAVPRHPAISRSLSLPRSAVPRRPPAAII